MKLGLNMGYWGAGNNSGNLDRATHAEQCGFTSVWVAEAYGSDAPTVLAWIAAHTESVHIGSAVMQIPARSPAMSAMTAATLDSLSGGRMRLGLGVSGPQVSEGWHGVRFARPLKRTREYVDIVRMALAREKVEYAGEHYQLPLPDGPGRRIKLTVADARADIPIYLAAIGPKNLELAGEIADGWLGLFLSPDHLETQLNSLRTGRQRGLLADRPIDVAPTIPCVTGENWRDCADAARGYYALYLGGMGSRNKNFYTENAVRMGFGDAARKVQELFLARDIGGAMNAVPAEFIDATAVLGPRSRCAEKMAAFAAAGVTTLNLAFMPGADDRSAISEAAFAFDDSGASS